MHRVYIDLEDLKLIQEYYWHVAYSPNNKQYYAEVTNYLGIFNGKAKYEIIKMHKLIMGVTWKDRRVLIDHKNHNTLDNRKDNLRKVESSANSKNRKGKNLNNKSGYRNVCKRGDSWIVQLQVNGKNTHLKSFPLEQLEEAGVYAAEMREKYYGKFKGNS